jgi:hypothetical protein
VTEPPLRADRRRIAAGRDRRTRTTTEIEEETTTMRMMLSDEPLDDVVARLRASRIRARGFKMGEQWARLVAEADELARLEDWTRQDQNWDRGLEGDGDDAFRASPGIARIIREEDLDLEGADLFWDEACCEVDMPRDVRENLDNPSFLTGFVLGSLSLWYAVKDRL